MLKLLSKLRCDTRGATAVEYGLILGLIVVALLGALLLFAQTSVDIWDNVADKVMNA